MLISRQLSLFARFLVIMTTAVWLCLELSRIPSPEIAHVREQQWALFEQRAQGVDSLETLHPIEASALQLLQKRPLDNRSLRLLAFVAEERQNYQQAKLLMQLAAERSKADSIANAWLVEFHLKERNWDAAFVHFEAGLRVYGPLQSHFMSMIPYTSQDPTGADVLSERLEEKPSWKNLVNRALQKAQAAASSTKAKPDEPRRSAGQPDASRPPQIVQSVLRRMGANRENNRCAAAVEGRPPRSKSDRLCSGAPALFGSGPLHVEDLGPIANQ